MTNPYTEALDGLRDALVERGRRYKRLVITVALGGITSVAAATWSGRPWPLVPMLWLPALVLGFHALDLRTVRRWRDTVVAAWARGELRIDLLRRTASQVPHLPAPTVTGMLDCLPVWTGDAPATEARRALARLQSQLGAAAELRLWLRAACWALFGAILMATAWRGAPLLLIACPAVPLLYFSGRAWSTRRTRRLTAEARQAMRQADAPQDPVAWLATLSTVGLPTAWQVGTDSPD